jgi:hypothetical protein
MKLLALAVAISLAAGCDRNRPAPTPKPKTALIDPMSMGAVSIARNTPMLK